MVKFLFANQASVKAHKGKIDFKITGIPTVKDHEVFVKSLEGYGVDMILGMDFISKGSFFVAKNKEGLVFRYGMD